MTKVKIAVIFSIFTIAMNIICYYYYYYNYYYDFITLAILEQMTEIEIPVLIYVLTVHLAPEQCEVYAPVHLNSSVTLSSPF
jgi:hypothetical protein